MKRNTKMTIEKTSKEYIIRIPSNVDIEGLQRLIDYLTYTEATANSVAQQKEVDALASEVKSGWWAKNRSRLIK